jgi:CBS domain containing-hemolysin-like protein
VKEKERSLDDGGSTQKRGKGLGELVSRFLLGPKKVTEEAIQELINTGEEEGLINQEENEMIRSIFSLRDTVVREIMVPRTDMASVSVEAPVHDVLQEIISCGHSRIPVYEGTVDNIVGLIYAKDLLKYWGMDNGLEDLRKILRPPYFIPETKNLEQLLQEFRKKRVHIAIVIDEYGGTSGLVTIEDLLEQIVGDIQDEYDTEDEWLVVAPDGSVTVDGRLPIEELAEYFHVTVERDKFDTVAGLIFHLAGRIPVAGDQLENNDLIFTVMAADQRKVSTVQIRRKPVSEENRDS